MAGAGLSATAGGGFPNASGGAMGGLMGGIVGGFFSSARGAPLFSGGLGFLTGALGGFVQDIVLESLKPRICKEGDTKCAS